MPGPAQLVIHSLRDVTVVNFEDTAILDTLQVEQIGEALYELVDGKACRKIILDFTKVQLLSSSALGILITLLKKSSEIKGRVVLCSLRPELRKIFKISRLDKMFEFADNEEEALETFGVTTAG